MKLQQLNEAIKARKGLGLSLSKIKMFDNCPYRFYLQFITKEKFDKKDFNPKFFKIGQFAHKWIESTIKKTECKFNSKTLSDEEKEDIKGNCANVFENDYIKSLLDKGEPETGFSLYIDPTEKDGLKAINRVKRDSDFSGYIDFHAIENGTLHVIDWKTGSVKGNDDETFMQLMLYAKALTKLKSSPNSVKLSYFYLDHNKLVSREFNKSDLEKKIKKIIDKGINIPTVNDPSKFPAKPGKVCNYCPYSVERSTDEKIVCEYTK